VVKVEMTAIVLTAMFEWCICHNLWYLCQHLIECVGITTNNRAYRPKDL